MKRGLLLLSILSAALAGTVCFILFSSQGFSLVLSAVSQFSKGAVSVEDSGGRLAGGWWVSGLIVRNSAADVSIGKLAVDWQLSDLFRGEFHVSAMEVEKLEIDVQQSDKGQPDQTRPAFDPPPVIFPLSVRLGRLVVDGGVVRNTGSPAPLFVINQLLLRAETNGNQLIVDELLLRSPEIDTTLEGTVTFTGSWPLALQGKWQVRPANYAPLNGSAVLSGTVENPGFELSVSDPFQVNLEGTITDTFRAFSWQLRADMDGLDPRLLSADLPSLTVAVEAEAAGTLDRYSGRIKAAVDPGGHIKPAFELLFSGSPSSVSIEPSPVDIGRNRATVSAQVDWSKELLFDVLVKTDDFELSAFNPQITGQVSLTARADGSYDDGLGYHLEVADFIGTIAGLNEDVLGGLILEGSESGLTIVSSDFSLGEGHIDLTGRLQWQEVLSWDARALVTSLSPGVVEPSLDGSVSAEIRTQGEMGPAAGADGGAGAGLGYHLEVAHFVGTIAGLNENVLGGLILEGSESGLTIVSSDFSLGEGHIDLTGRLQWQEALSWEARALVTSVSPSVVEPSLDGSVSAEIRTQGEMGPAAGADGGAGVGLGYHLEVAHFVGTIAGLNEKILGRLTLEGSESGLTVVSSDFSLGEGHIDLTGRLQWQEALSWDARALVTSFSPSVIEPSVVGSINAEISSNGVLSEERLDLDIDLKNVSGLLGGYEVSGGGAIDYRDGDIGIHNLLFKNGKNHLEVHGSIADTLALSFLLEGSELTRLLPSLGGAVSARGNVTGTKAYPEVVMVIDAENLSYRDYSAGTIAADIKVSTAHEGVADASVTAERLTIAGTPVRHAGVEITGSREQHQLSMVIDSDHGALSVSTAGVLDADNVWKGQITALRAEHLQVGVLRSSGVPTVQLSKQSADIREFCLASEDIRFLP